MKGYDIDGVITAGIKPESEAVIITGRSYEEAPETYQMLRGLSIFNAVYFNPMSFDKKTPHNAGRWKAEMVKQLKIKEFSEDSELQANEIRKRCPDIIIHLIK